MKKSSFLLKVLKTYVFTKITECSIVTDLHFPELKSRATFNHKQQQQQQQQQKLCIPYIARKNVFIKKSQKYGFLI